jgi:hypothetical protein
MCPPRTVTCVLRPSQYQLLLTSRKVVNRDYVQSASNGGVDTGKIFQVNGVEIVKSNNLRSPTSTPIWPSTTWTARTPRGQVFHKSAVGTVKLMDLAMEAEYQIQRQGWLFIAKYAMGHGILRPEASVEIKTA